MLAIGWAATGVASRCWCAEAPRSRPTARTGRVPRAAGLGGIWRSRSLSAIAVGDLAEVMNGYEALTPAGAAAVAALAAGCPSPRESRARTAPWRIAPGHRRPAPSSVLTALTLDGLQLVLDLDRRGRGACGVRPRRTGDEVAPARRGRLPRARCVPRARVRGATRVARDRPGRAGRGDAALAAVAAGAWCCRGVERAGAGRAPGPEGRWRRSRSSTSASTAVVTPFESDGAVDSALLSAHQQGQMVLSVFWALVGVGTIVVGLRRDLSVVRHRGAGLLGVAVGEGVPVRFGDPHVRSTGWSRSSGSACCCSSARSSGSACARRR